MKEIFSGIYYINKYSNDFCNLVNSGKLVQNKFYLMQGSYEIYRRMIAVTYEGRDFLIAELSNGYIGFAMSFIDLYKIGVDTYTTDEYKYFDVTDDVVISVWRNKLADALKWKDFEVLRYILDAEQDKQELEGFQ